MGWESNSFFVIEVQGGFWALWEIKSDLNNFPWKHKYVIALFLFLPGNVYWNCQKASFSSNEKWVEIVIGNLNKPNNMIYSKPHRQGKILDMKRKPRNDGAYSHNSCSCTNSSFTKNCSCRLRDKCRSTNIDYTEYISQNYIIRNNE